MVLYEEKSHALLHYISLPALILAWLLHMFVGMLWYSPTFFGDPFMRLAHGGKPPVPDVRAILASAVGAATALPFFALLLAVADVRTAGQGALWGLGLGFFFDGGLNVPHPFFEERPFALFVLHRGYHIVSLTLVGGLLGMLCGA